MVGNGLLGQSERFGEFAHRGVTLGEATHQGAADGVTKGGEGGIEWCRAHA